LILPENRVFFFFSSFLVDIVLISRPRTDIVRALSRRNRSPSSLLAKDNISLTTSLYYYFFRTESILYYILCTPPLKSRMLKNYAYYCLGLILHYSSGAGSIL